MKKLLFGTAGIPLSTKEYSSEGGVKRVRELDLDAMELEFVRGVRMTKEKTKVVKKVAQENNVVLTAHGPYYINLNSNEKHKVQASIKRILDTARIANLCGGYSITFHAGFYIKQDPKKVYGIVKTHLKEIISTLKQEKNKIWVRPETTGKTTQFGSLEEILQLSREIGQIMPCVDFAHLHARTGGKLNSPKDFHEILENVEKAIGKTGLQNMHIHMSGIEYTAKGEKRHLVLQRSDIKYKELLTALKEFKVGGVIISESPNIEEDALLMKKYYDTL